MRGPRWHLRSVLIAIAVLGAPCADLAHRARVARRAAILGPLAAARLKLAQGLYTSNYAYHVSGTFEI